MNQLKLAKCIVYRIYSTIDTLLTNTIINFTRAIRKLFTTYNSLFKCSGLLARPYFYHIAAESHCALVVALSEKMKYHSACL